MSSRWTEYRQALLEKVDFIQTYERLGLKFAKEKPDSKGWLSAYSHEKFGGSDNTPSAAVNLNNGVYKDFRADKSYGIFDFIVAVGEVNTWREAQVYLAQRYDFKVPSLSKNHPENKVVWQEWKDPAAEKFCQRRPPITIEGLKKSGAQMCTWYDTPAFAWAVYDNNLHVIGYYFMPRSGGTFPQTKSKSICKIYPDHEAGFIGLPAIQSLLSDRHPDVQDKIKERQKDGMGPEYRGLLWVEGVPDMLAAYSLFPDSNEFITNPHGASENVTGTQVAMLSASPIRLGLLADCDLPGILGATKKSQQLQSMWTDKIGYGGNVFCPYQPSQATAKNGKDLRDWLVEQELAPLSGPQVDPEGPVMKLVGRLLHKVDDPKEIQALEEQHNEKILQVHEQRTNQIAEMMQKLNLKIYMVYDDGSFIVGSTHTNRSLKVRSAGMLQYCDGLALCGHPFLDMVGETELAQGQLIDFAEFKRRLSLALSDIATRQATILGQGIWNVDDANDGTIKHLALVKQGDYYFLDQNQLIHRSGPDYGTKYLVDYEDSLDWFDMGQLNRYLAEATDISWRTQVHGQLMSYLRTWKWAHNEMDIVAAGLVYATWIQSTWKWRPIVTLTGESESGKTWLLDMLSEIYLGTCAPMGASTAAGVMQNIRNQSLPIFCDEFDATKQHQKIYREFRATSRGQAWVKGTSSQKARLYRLNHIPWLSGIFQSTDSQADLNRLIAIHLLKTDKGVRTIIRPTPAEAHELGHKILASVLVTAEKALKIHRELIYMGERSRYRESYSVPYSSMAAICGMPIENVNALMTNYMKTVVEAQHQEYDALNDHEAILLAIMNSKIRLPHDAPMQEPTVGMMLTAPEYAPYISILEPYGIGVKQERGGEFYVIFNPTMLVSNDGALARTEWRGNVGIRDVLRRLIYPPFNIQAKSTRLAGQVRHCYHITLENLKKWMLREKRDEKLL